MSTTSVLSLIVGVVHLVFVGRAILRTHREPASRVAWAVVILVFPLVGIGAYLFFGEVNVGARQRRREAEALRQLPEPGMMPDAARPNIDNRLNPLFQTIQSVNGFAPSGGNCVELLSDSNSAIDRLVGEIDGACEHVHVCFYIWLADRNGLKVVEALKRAAARGVVCRVIADSLGSRILIASSEWHDMRVAGVRT